MAQTKSLPARSAAPQVPYLSPEQVKATYRSVAFLFYRGEADDVPVVPDVPVADLV
jgi:hypothetical protein